MLQCTTTVPEKRLPFSAWHLKALFVLAPSKGGLTELVYPRIAQNSTIPNGMP